MRGYLPFADKATGKVINEYWWQKISNGKIKDVKKKIDFYCWINKKENGQDQIFFDKVTEVGKETVEKYFAQQLISDLRAI